MKAAKWLRPIVRPVEGNALSRHMNTFPYGRYWLVAWGPFLLLIERGR